MQQRMSQKTRIRTFDFDNGYLVAEKYRIISKLGAGWEGEVYLTEELDTGIERTAKFFYPQRNVRNSAALAYAKKLHKVRQSPVIIQYHNREQMLFQDLEVTCLISEYVDGDLLQDFINRHPRRRLQSYQALHLLHAMACGLESIHQLGEYHGDLHTGNVFVKQRGIFFDIRLFDLFDWKDSKRENMRKDICDLIRIFYDCLGGASTYRLQSDEIKYIICGLRRDMILNKFPSVAALRTYLENFEWN